MAVFEPTHFQIFPARTVGVAGHCERVALANLTFDVQLYPLHRKIMLVRCGKKTNEKKHEIRTSIIRAGTWTTLRFRMAMASPCTFHVLVFIWLTKDE